MAQMVSELSAPILFAKFTVNPPNNRSRTDFLIYEDMMLANRVSATVVDIDASSRRVELPVVALLFVDIVRVSLGV